MDWWHLVSVNDHCNNYYVSYVAVMLENPNAKKFKGARLIPLTRGMYTIVDERDFTKLSKYNWFARKSDRNYYAFRTVGKKHIRMHRAITHAPKGMVVDHIDHDGLNNRRSNLRVCTIKQNSRNARSHKGTSRYKGVYWLKRNSKWTAEILCDGKKKFLGYFKNEIDAALAYDKTARKLFAEYAYLNFPDVAK